MLQDPEPTLLKIFDDSEKLLFCLFRGRVLLLEGLIDDRNTFSADCNLIPVAEVIRHRLRCHHNERSLRIQFMFVLPVPDAAEKTPSNRLTQGVAQC